MRKRALIAVVDDDRGGREALERLIQGLGYEAISFDSADDLVSSGRLDQIACLLIDVQMPGQSGFDLHDQVVANGNQPPVIFVTAYLEAFSGQFKKRGAAGFLTKPFCAEALKECLELVLSNSRQCSHDLPRCEARPDSRGGGGRT